MYIWQCKQSDVKKNVVEGRGGGDADYWDRMLQEILIQRARQFVKEVHISLIKKQLELLSDVQMEQRELRQRTLTAAAEEEEEAANLARDADYMLQRRVRAAAGTGEGEEDADRARVTTKPTSATVDGAGLGDGDGDEEQEMAGSDEVVLPGATYSWDSKYRPRKPRYINKIRTGWDWNKYNSTHYDRDNPPPKVVQGYMFTLFYSDLIDKEKTPKFFIERCEGTTDFVILRFHAGPPYEDVAFKIVNQEWDIHRKAGYRSSFDRGVLQLTFNFKRRFYRR